MSVNDRENHLDRLRKLAEALEQAERMGNSEDMPEGLRYIQISDTLAKQWVDTIREVTGDKYNQT